MNIEFDTNPKPWQQQPGESTEDFKLFCRYRDGFSKRSYSYVALCANKSRRTIIKLSKKNNWRRRVALFDIYINSNDKNFKPDYFDGYFEKLNHFKTTYAELNFAIAQNLFEYMRNSDKYINDPVIENELKFYRCLCSMMNILLKNAEISFGTKFKSDRAGGDFRIKDIVNSTKFLDTDLIISNLQEITSFFKKKNQNDNPLNFNKEQNDIYESNVLLENENNCELGCNSPQLLVSHKLNPFTRDPSLVNMLHQEKSL